ncbi:Pkinase-domain-containing protein [Melanogaster broomeanus]|nr:Pkinase-domain-containing protein [Melanogaster broomeanus]
MSALGHKHSVSVSQNQKAQLANAYNELGKELASQKIRVIGNYTLGKIPYLTGAYGKVRMGTHRLTSARVAIKQIPKAMSASLTREIHHHRQLHHPHVTQMYEVIATESHIWLVTELCSGGELFDYLAEKGRLSEDEARIIFGQLCLAVAYLHDKGIVHRDLKLENVLLDERCRVKLGDFGFTREYENGVYMETFCGTTGYAAPEVLQGTRYMGPEVDIWSMGVILYCLLTGTLPFDDDDDTKMKEKVIKGEYEDPEWLTQGARDVIRNILQSDPSKRLTIPQILASSWFITQTVAAAAVGPEDNVPSSPSPARDTFPLVMKPTINGAAAQDSEPSGSSATSATSESTFLSASSDLVPSVPPTPVDNVPDPFQDSKDAPVQIHPDPSQSTITKGETGSNVITMRRPETMIEEEGSVDHGKHTTPSVTSSSNTARAPPHPTRTPARTKRRSVSSMLSDGNGSPQLEKPLAPLPPQDFSSLLNTPAPIIFSTPAERELLNGLSAMGFDTAQIVHSVISDACDSAGALWWMLMRKHEKRIFGEVRAIPSDPVNEEAGASSGSKRRKDDEGDHPSSSRRRTKRGVAVQTEEPTTEPTPPAFAVVPPTPTLPTGPRPSTPPRAKSPFLSPSPTTNESSGRSNPSTPSGSYRSGEGRDKDPLRLKREGKPRSGSVTIMQRATTALEAAGLVRKKSTDGVKEQREREREREKEKSRENEKISGGDDPRSSHGSGGSSKLTKSPPVRAKDAVIPPSTPTPDLPAMPGSPWVLAGERTSPGYTATPVSSPGDTLRSLPNFREDGGRVVAPNRNRASLLSAFRLWFQEDRKGKRKETMQQLPQGNGRGLQYSHSVAGPASMSPAGKGSVKRRASGSGRGRRVKRQSASSRRSSSVNSRRSSGNSGPVFVLEHPHTLDQIPSVQSFGVDTPNSERGDYSSRPSSIRSFSLGGGKHHKSPSAGSNGSAYHRTSSPLPKYNHRRAGSSSSTRVVRHIQNPPGASRPVHHRTNSAASSVYSLGSSRPTSFYEASEGEGPRTSSPFKGYPSRRSLDDSTPRRGAGTFIAQKRLTPFMSPHNSGSIGRTSWKKSWGHEPPGWQSRSTHLPVEVLAISPAPDIRDVFSSSGGRQSLGDESDWVDEDDEVPEFAGGLGQMPGSSTTSASSSYLTLESSIPLVTSPPPRSHSVHGRAGKARASAGGTGRQKGGHSPAGRSSPAPGPNEMAYDGPESRGGRWQLPPTRGPAFKHPIQEEDEGEEE